MKKIENIQKGSLSYVFKDYSSSYRELRLKANKPLLYVQPLRYISLEVYTIVNRIGPRYFNEMFNFREMSYDLRRGHTILPFNYNTIHH